MLPDQEISSTADLVACPWLFFPFPPMVNMRSILCVTKRDCYFIIKSFFDCSLHHPPPTSPSPPPSLPHPPSPHPHGFHMKPLCAICVCVNPHGYLPTHKVSRRCLFWMLFKIAYHQQQLRCVCVCAERSLARWYLHRRMFLLRGWRSVSCSLFTNVIDFALHIFNTSATAAAAEVILKWLNGVLLSF